MLVYALGMEVHVFALAHIICLTFMQVESCFVKCLTNLLRSVLAYFTFYIGAFEMCVSSSQLQVDLQIQKGWPCDLYNV